MKFFANIIIINRERNRILLYQSSVTRELDKSKFARKRNVLFALLEKGRILLLLSLFYGHPTSHLYRFSGGMISYFTITTQEYPTFSVLVGQIPPSNKVDIKIQS